MTSLNHVNNKSAHGLLECQTTLDASNLFEDHAAYRCLPQTYLVKTTVAHRATISQYLVSSTISAIFYRFFLLQNQ